MLKGNSEIKFEIARMLGAGSVLMRICGAFCLAALLLFGGGALQECHAASGTGAVSLESLLNEMVNRDTAARLPAASYVCKEASSHDHRKNDPWDPAGWHSNDDHEQFIRTEMNEGRREWVIMEDSGPGAIARFWTPLSADKDDQIIRFYFDGSATPAISVKFNELMSGKGFVPPPFAFVSWNETDVQDEKKAQYKAPRGVGGDLYLPIPFAKSCKITLDKIPFYYVINYRMYEPGTRVSTFAMSEYKAAQPTLDRVGAMLTSPVALDRKGDNKVETKSSTLAPGAELSLDLRSGASAVRALTVKIDPKDAPQALRSTVLQATFDGEPSIWCPIGEFFGAGVRLNPVQDWCRTVGADGTLTARWVMPYQRTGHISLKNAGDRPITVSLTAAAAPWKWDDRSLYFHASWRCQIGLKTRPFSDWNYVDVRGRGTYVGDTLTVFSPVHEWYGEGDERIYVDDETFPSHIGTGTEDYYGYAWGMATYFSSPFISIPRRDSVGGDNWKGYTTTSRLRLLDTIPMKTGIKHDMEIWNWADTQVDYAVGTFWYARPGARSNREPQWIEAAAKLKEGPVEAPPLKIAGAVECEAMEIMGKSGGIQTQVQGAGLHDGQWSGGQQLFVMAQKVGDFIELVIPTNGDKPVKVTLYGTKSADYGVLRFQVNGKTAVEWDSYAPTAAASGPVELGTFQPEKGRLVLRAEVTGTNPASKGSRYYFGLDCVVLHTL